MVTLILSSSAFLKFDSMTIYFALKPLLSKANFEARIQLTGNKLLLSEKTKFSEESSLLETYFLSLNLLTYIWNYSFLFLKQTIIYYFPYNWYS